MQKAIEEADIDGVFQGVGISSQESTKLMNDLMKIEKKEDFDELLMLFQ